MRRQVNACVAVSAAAILAAMSAPGIGAQATATKQQSAPAAGKEIILAADALQWGPAPPALPPGAQAAILDGDPAANNLFVVRLKFPDGYKVPPHWHPTAERVVVISGTLMVGMGPKVNEASMKALSTGGYAHLPGKMNHYVRAKGETIVQITAQGPFEVTYADPQNDPRKKSPAK